MTALAQWPPAVSPGHGDMAVPEVEVVAPPGADEEAEPDAATAVAAPDHPVVVLAVVEDRPRAYVAGGSGRDVPEATAVEAGDGHAAQASRAATTATTTRTGTATSATTVSSQNVGASNWATVPQEPVTSP